MKLQAVRSGGSGIRVQTLTPDPWWWSVAVDNEFFEAEVAPMTDVLWVEGRR
jgi:hypothetical protein